MLPDTCVCVPGLCSAYVYLTNSSIAYLDSAISNPEANPYDILKAAPKLYELGAEVAKAHGYKYLVAYTDKFGRFFKGATKFAPNAWIKRIQ